MKSKFGPKKSINLAQRIKMIGIVGNAQWLIVLWGYWIDKNREKYDKQ